MQIVKWLFVFGWIALLAFSLEPIRRAKGDHHVLVWRLGDESDLIRVFPNDVYVLFDHGAFYAYLDETSAVRLDTERRHSMKSYRDLLLGMEEYPVSLPYDPLSRTLIEILNSVKTE